MYLLDLLFLFFFFILVLQILYGLAIGYELALRLIGAGMHLGVDLGVVKKCVVVFHKLATRFLIQTALGKRHDQQALYHRKDLLQGPLSRLPVAFKNIDADVATRSGHVGMEHFSQKVALRRILRESAFQNKFAPEHSACVRCLHYEM